ncbi:hypothetical protein GCM10020000_84740 [Streptomyces olivoverticillatus]
MGAHTTAFPAAASHVAVPSGLERLDATVVMSRLDAIGVEGIAWPWTVEELWGAPGMLRAKIRAVPVPGDQATWAPLLDAALGIVPVVYGGPPTVRMPAHIREVRVAGRAPETAFADIRLVDADTDTVDIVISDEEHRLLAWLSGTRFGALRATAGAGGADSGSGSVQAQEPGAEAGPAPVWEEKDPQALAERVAQEVRRCLEGEMKNPRR